MTTWTDEQLRSLADAKEMQVATRRDDGSLRAFTPIWVVVVGGDVFVRSWYRRETGWFGRAVAHARAWVRVPGLETEVSVDDLGDGPDDVHAQVSAAYREKYGRLGARSMVRADAVATTLRLTPASDPA